MRLKTVGKIVGNVGASLLLLGGFTGVAAAAPDPSLVFVSHKNCSNSGPGTNQTPYCTVQEGLNAVAAGGQVNVDKGTYNEQVTFKKNKDNVTLRGNGKNTVIQIPSNTAGTIVDVKDNGAVINDISVSGPFTTNTCNDNEYGVQVENNASATIQHSWITNIEEQNSANHGCQQGVAVEVGNGKNDAARATVANNTITGYQKNGVTVEGKGSKATISNNTITGYGPTSQIAQNGVQVSDGATATIRDNAINGNVYTPQTYASTGVLILQPGTGVNVSQNNLNQNDVGIDIDDATHQATVSQNTVKNSTFNGIYAYTTATGNSFTQNTARGTSGAQAPYTSYDVEDDSSGSGTLGTANTWHQNSCKTSYPDGLCKV